MADKKPTKKPASNDLIPQHKRMAMGMMPVVPTKPTTKK
jgi:hypothetical protein